jgi:hypothetical protein
MAKENENAFKFGVEDLADVMGIEPASVRIKLRNAGVKKANGNAYGWKTKDELKALADKLKTTKAAPAKKEAAKPAAKKAAAKGKDAAKKKAA